MAVTHLVDTSVLTRMRDREIREVVEPLAVTGRAARTTISDLEVGYAARNDREWDDLMGALGAFVPLEVAARHLQRAKQVQRVLAQRSQRGRKIPDLLVAAVAEESELVVLHYDADFDLIARATGQTCEWVVSAGSVD